MPFEPIEPSEAVELYLEDKENELAQASLYAHKSRLGHFLRWCEEEDVSNLNELTGRKLHEYRLWRREDGDLATASEKTQMDTLRVFIRWSESIDAVPQNLSEKVISPSLSEEENTRDVMVDAEDAEEILGYLRKYEYASERHVVFRLMWRAGLRRGTIVALDLDDYDPDEQSLEIVHRPESETPLKKKQRGERFVGLVEETCDVIDAWVEDRRPDQMDDYGRDPLMTTSQGRAQPGTIQSYVYSVTRPCFWKGTCPHDEEIEECEAASDRTKASQCPSSKSPHAVRRGAVTHWLSEDLPERFVSDRANMSPEILRAHYDRRSPRDRMEQRRGYLDNI